MMVSRYLKSRLLFIMQKLIASLGLFLLLATFATKASAYTFPNDAVTYATTTQGVISHQILSGQSTVLAIRMTQENQASNSKVQCGSVVIAQNFAKDFPMSLMSYYCASDLRIEKTGADSLNVQVTYVPYKLSDKSEQITIQSSSTINVSPTSTINLTDQQKDIINYAFQFGTITFCVIVFLLILIYLGIIVI